jgi:cell division protein FtsQ
MEVSMSSNAITIDDDIRTQRRSPKAGNDEPHNRFAWIKAHRRQIAWIALLLGVIVILWFAIRGILDRPIQHAEISGKFAQVSRIQIEQVLEPYARKGFLSIDLDKVKTSLEAIRWIDHVRVERAWPDGVRVFVTEQVAVARWGEKGLLNTRGELFLPDARDVRADLPQLNGPEGTEGEVAKLYLDTYPRLLTVGLTLSRVSLDERGAWILQLRNGIEVRLGREDVAARLERFIRAASPVIATRTGDVAYVDMRYSNGFSIGWGKPLSTNASNTDRANDTMPNFGPSLGLNLGGAHGNV